jgi:prolyl oligopeptidase PreP (S9A serine peptidase family)
VRYEIDKYLKITSASNAVWLANGEGLAYISNASGTPQIWRIGLDCTHPEQLTHSNNRVWSVWSLKDTPGIVFTMDVGGNERNQIFMLTLDGSIARNLTSNPEAVHQFGGIRDKDMKLVYASNARNEACFDICMLDLRDGTSEIVLQNEDSYNTPAALSPDGRYLLYNKLKGASDNALWMLDLEARKAHQVPVDGGIGVFARPVWNSSSSGFYLLTDKDSDFMYLAGYDLASGKMETVHKEDWDIETLALSSDDRYLAFTVNSDGYSVLKVMDTASGKMVELPDMPLGVISPYATLNWSPNGYKLAFSLTSGARTSDIWVLDLDRNEVKQVTFSSLSGVGEDGFVEPELIRFVSFDGLEVPAWLFRPLEADSDMLPVVINIHGGPEGQERPIFNPIIQYLVNQGFAVVAPNVRGSTGYGKRYHHLDDVEKRMDSVADINSLVDYLVQSKIADPDRIGVMGASYGGFMTLASITEYPNLWAAAVDVVGIANFETFMENTSAYRRVHRGSEYGTLEHHRDVLRRVSPIHKVDRITCPLMVIHGANDPRVPVGEAEQIVENLRNRGREVQYLRYEDEGHGIVKLANRLDCYPKVAAFFKRHLGLE